MAHAEIIAPDMKHFALAPNVNEDPDHRVIIDVGTRRQLLFDEFFISLGKTYEQYPRNIRWVHGDVRKEGRALFAGLDGDEGIAWMQVMREGGRFRLWYNAYRDKKLTVREGESDDGLQFREALPAGGEPQIFRGKPDGTTPEFGNVFVDPRDAPERRYKMVYSDWLPTEIQERVFSHSVGVLRGAASPDGFRWTRYYETFIGNYCDSQNVAAYHAHINRYVIYHRWGAFYGGLNAGSLRVDPELRGRAVGRVESRDFRHWSLPQVVLAPDSLDGLGCDTYNSAYSHYADADMAHFMFPSVYHHYEGNFEVQVATSRDGANWQRPIRRPFVPLGQPGEFDEFIISIAPGFVALGDDELALYYRGGNIPHAGAAPVMSEEERQRRMPPSRLGRLRLRRDRIIGIEASAQGGTFCTRALSTPGGRLTVNVQPTAADGELLVALLDARTNETIPGRGFEDAVPVRGDCTSAEVHWTSGPDLTISDRPLRLHFRFRSMRLFAFQFLPMH